MSNRREIQDGSQFDRLTSGIVYTDVLGWIDMGHARGDDIALLKNQFLAGESSRKEYYEVIYRQDMHISRFGNKFGVGKFSKWEIKRGRSGDDINRIMLAMMMNTATQFERSQSLRAFSWFSDSGFSGEDLVSDLFGLYRFMIPGKYSHQVNAVSYDAAIRRWDYYGPIGSYKNYGFRPMIFPDPDEPCIKYQPYKVELPSFMTWMRPWEDFSSGIVKATTNNGTSLKYGGII